MSAGGVCGGAVPEAAQGGLFGLHGQPVCSDREDVGQVSWRKGGREGPDGLKDTWDWVGFPFGPLEYRLCENGA